MGLIKPNLFLDTFENGKHKNEFIDTTTKSYSRKQVEYLLGKFAENNTLPTFLVLDHHLPLEVEPSHIAMIAQYYVGKQIEFPGKTVEITAIEIRPGEGLFVHTKTLYTNGTN